MESHDGMDGTIKPQGPIGKNLILVLRRSGNCNPVVVDKVLISFQVFNRCTYGVWLPGEEGHDQFVIEERRRRDRFLDLHHDDILWANMIRAHQDLLALDRKVMTDDVLYDLLKMGIQDWSAPNDRLNQTTPVMCHATTMQMRMLAQHLSLEDKVSPVLLCD